MMDAQIPELVVALLSEFSVYFVENSIEGRTQSDADEVDAAKVLELVFKLGNDFLDKNGDTDEAKKSETIRIQKQGKFHKVFVNDDDGKTPNAKCAACFAGIDALMQRATLLLSRTHQSVSMTEQATFEAQGLPLLILNFLQYLCEGHNRMLQRLLHAPSPSTNILGTIVAYLDALTQALIARSELITMSRVIERSQLEFLKATVKVANQTLDTMTEVVQGPCKENQDALINTKLCFYINTILQAPLPALPIHVARRRSSRWDIGHIIGATCGSLQYGIRCRRRLAPTS
jgi:hypothetical protein